LVEGRTHSVADGNIRESLQRDRPGRVETARYGWVRLHSNKERKKTIPEQIREIQVEKWQRKGTRFNILGSSWCIE